MSLVDVKCGFDAKFFELLKKNLSKKSNILKKRFHGVVTIDEIALRQSIAVRSDDLTYEGLANMGEDGLKSTDINDLADHGLVVQFQSINDKFCQPIAVFTSKNAVHGEELAKIVIKAICMLENAGAIIHGVVSDGASTNRKMWKHFGIDASQDNLKTFFTHPLNENRKVFVFSDTPHLIKCVRNRLYNKQRLRVRVNFFFIRIKFITKFVILK